MRAKPQPSGVEQPPPCRSITRNGKGAVEPEAGAAQHPATTEESAHTGQPVASVAGAAPQPGPNGVDITQYGPRASGGRACAVTLPSGLRVLVDPSEESQNQAALDVARRTVEGEASLAAALADITRLREQVQRLENKVRDLRTINEAAITGRRRFFGPVLLKAGPDGWTGAVWLLDPDKKERGLGLQFASLAEVHTMHPELWVIGTTADGVLLDAWAEVRHG